MRHKHRVIKAGHEMPKLKFTVPILLAAFVVACDKNEPAAQQTKIEPPSPPVAAAVETPAAADPVSTATNSSSSVSNAGTKYINHDKDEVEFALKRSLDGAQSRLEDATNPGQIEMIKNDIAEIQAQLDAL